ncbi:hypothetical protein [Paenibacillus sp. Marseille-Q4541]|uniref:hypothetical protein n=1 Tax=Paenibacillus sp. Marseille-Q4541 TaxID=2831522 RepID=UPI001BA613D4|nr:hypothetical protein [Paenibacillus sp. Marseille-Q4541]
MGNLFKIIISKLLPSKQDSIKEENSGNLEEKKFTPLTLGDADYKDVELEKAFVPQDIDTGQKSEEVRRLKSLAAKTKNKRIKKKLEKRIENNT